MTYFPCSNGLIARYCISIISVNPISCIAESVFSDTTSDKEENFLSSSVTVAVFVCVCVCVSVCVCVCECLCVCV